MHKKWEGFGMQIKNLKVRENMAALALVTTLSLVSLTGCGNKQLLDFNKSFNVAIETNGTTTSIVGIQEYTDYTGAQIQFVTNDGLRVLTSTHQTQLMKAFDQFSVEEYAFAVSGNKPENIVDYNELQGIEISFEIDNWNKDILDMHFVYNKAIILTDNVATIVPLETWRDYEEDDKLQLKLEDGTCILVSSDKVKLINDDDAKEDSLHNYALSLVGSEDSVVYYNPSKEYTK